MVESVMDQEIEARYIREATIGIKAYQYFFSMFK